MFTREDAARIVCAVLQQQGKAASGFGKDGVSVKLGLPTVSIAGRTATFDRDLKQILDAVERRCGRVPVREAKGFAEAAAAAAVSEDGKMIDAVGVRGQAEGVLELAIQELNRDGALFTTLLEWMGTILTVLGTVVAIARFIPAPPIRLAASGLGFAVKRLAGFQGAIIARKAANDSAFIQIQRTLEILRKAA